MNNFADEKINLDALKKKAFNFRWAEVEDGIIPLTAADPDYPCAEAIKKAMAEYIEDGYFSYTPRMGLKEFKESFSRYVKRRKNEDINPELVLPIDSAARAMFEIAQTFLKPGDEMIVFDPCDFLFREACISAGATPVCAPVSIDTSTRKMDLTAIEKVITPNTKMLGLCNPHNPYGLTYTKEELDYIMSLCEKNDILIMNDEIWSDIIYPDAQFNSIYCLGNKRCDRVLSLFGYSKSFGLAGLRIGCMYTTDKEKFDKLVNKSQVMNTAGGATSLSQVAAIAAMNETEDWFNELIDHLTSNRDYAVDFINKIPHLHAYKPMGTYLLYVDISELGMSGAEFTAYLQEKVKLAIIPGGHQFFGDMSEGHVRICIATSNGILKEGLNRLKKGVELLIEEKSL
ncbi:MAG: pyridoxal phosphate-dependent aminotransferase [Erysipelotrichaceae bacterium]|nr:pyridoxal phosphate-dependent aminotransferase [Erysipelotrichaceae bacterium]